MKSSRDLENGSYNYSKIKLVNVFGRRTLPYQILAMVKLLLFQYPAIKDAEEPLAQLSLLSSSLATNGYVVPDQLTDGQKSRILIEIEVLSLGPLFRRYEPNMDKRNLKKKPVITEDDLTSCRFLNVSTRLVFKTPKEHKQTTYKNVSACPWKILGYSLPLICGAKVLFKSKDPEAYRVGCGHPASGMLKVLESFGNVLLLVALLRTARVFQMVTESRSKPQSKGTSKLRYASKD
ncbi:Protein of unknown function DUF2921 - like 7 [Theobroma cacao]|nr:Protein of unknown function DUF2921 - like 7 [Theobroma cacao]